MSTKVAITPYTERDNSIDHGNHGQWMVFQGAERAIRPRRPETVALRATVKEAMGKRPLGAAVALGLCVFARDLRAFKVSHFNLVFPSPYFVFCP